MKEITHNQARRYMQADLDGLLSDDQRLDLDAHLDSCPACRAESESFSTLTSRLRSEFHERWDAHNGPSQHVTANVRSQTRRIIMSNKVKWGLGALGGAVALVLLGLGLNFLFSQMQGRSVAANETTVPDDNNLHVSAAQVDGQWIAFQMEKDGNMDIYAIRTDGSALTNLTDNPGSDASSVWSPDGTRIAFVSDRDGNENIYVMNMDGSGLTRLTDDPGSDTAPLWSPDGRKLAYQSRDLNANFTNIFVVDSNGQNRHKLTNDIPGAVFPSEWSQDGKFIFTNIDYQIVKINIDTGNIIPLAVAGQFTVSADGSQILHLVGCGENSAEFCNIVKTVHIDGTNEETHSSMEIKQVCSSPEVTNGHYYMTKWSPDRNKILFAFYCEKNGGSFYIANADGSNFRSLANYPILGNGGGFDWSPDSHSIIFTSSFDGEDDGLYILNITEILQNPALRPARLHPTVTNPLFPSWQPVMQEDALVEEDSINIEQSPNANNRLLAFTMERNGNTDVYTVRADGSDLTDLTGDSNGNNPYWSPDGRRIAFNRDIGNRSQVFVMDADGSNVVQLTDDGDFNKLVAFEEGRDPNFNAWSPDGSKLVFVKLNHQQANNEEWMRFYVLDVATKTQTPLTPEWGAYQSPAWSPGGEHVAFTSFSRFNEQGEPTRLSIHIVGADGSNPVDLTASLPDNVFSFLHRWSSDGGSVIFSASNQAQDSMQVYEARLDGTLTELSQPIRADLLDWWNGTTLTLGNNRSTLNWLRPDGTRSTLTTCPDGGQARNISSARSNSANVFLGVQCLPGEWHLYLASKDGGAIQQLLDPPLSSGIGVMADQAWSPDGNFIAFNISSRSQAVEMFILDVAATLADPSTQPVWFNVGEIFSSTDSISWQPVITEETLAERPPQPYEGLVAFTSAVENGNLDIYTMHTDGGDLVNITGHPANDTNPVWSPDGKRLAFLSDRSGSSQIYSMSPSGTELIQLTDIPDTWYWGYTNWSPDGKHLVAQRIPIESKSGGRYINLYLINADGSGAFQLTENESGADYSPKWSPGGERIAFIRSVSKSNQILSQIYTVRTDGTGLFNLSNPGRDDAAFTWSADGAWITHFSSPNNCPYPDDCPASEIQSVRADGTERATLLVLPNSLTLDVARTDWSPDGMRVVMVSWDSPLGSTGNSYLSILSPFSNSDIVSRKIPGHIAQAYWSPDGQFFIYGSDVSGNWDIYTLDANEVLQNPEAEPTQRTNSPREDTSPAWQPVITEETLSERPPQPYEGLVAFTSAVENGNLDIYTMRPDGSGLTNLTKNPARDVDPYWSPDGKRIAFLSDRAGYMQVFTMNADGSDVFQVTRREADHEFASADPWSPDGSMLAFLERSPDGQKRIYTIDANGWSGLPLVYPPGNYSSLSWSPDGGHIAYIALEPVGDRTMARIHVTATNGDNNTDITGLLPEDEDLYSSNYTWTQRGRSITFIAARVAWENDNGKFAVYEAALDGTRLVEITKTSTPIADWWKGTTFVRGFTGETLTWLRSDGTYSEFKPFENCQMGRDFQGGSFPRRSPNGYLLYAAGCPNGDVWLYWANPDGTDIRQLLPSPINTVPAGLPDIYWSPDSSYVTLTVNSPGITDLYILDVQEVLKNPLATPEPIPIGGGDLYYNISWQPTP